MYLGMISRLASHLLLSTCVSITCVFAQDPVISEFLAINESGLADGNGEASDWIEIHNPGAGDIDLTGWHLTDSSEDLIRWTFPAGAVIAGGEYALVFASGDVTPPSSEWHASFSLSGSGEYLALVKPDGVTVTSEFSPMFPKQRKDVSFGRDLGGGLRCDLYGSVWLARIALLAHPADPGRCCSRRRRVRSVVRWSAGPSLDHIARPLDRFGKQVIECRLDVGEVL